MQNNRATVGPPTTGTGQSRPPPPRNTAAQVRKRTLQADPLARLGRLGSDRSGYSLLMSDSGDAEPLVQAPNYLKRQRAPALSTSCTRLRLPMKGMRARGASPFWSV